MPFQADQQPQAQSQTSKSSFVPDSAPGAPVADKQQAHDFNNTNPDALERENYQALPSRLGAGIKAGVGVMAPEMRMLPALGSGVAASLTSQKLQGQDVSLGQTVKDVAANVLLPKGIAGLGKFLGIGADKAQQTAMGMKKYSPGVGTTAIEQGVRGTKLGMQGKMAGAIANEGENLDKMVGTLKGSVSSEPVANRVADFGERYISPEGYSTEAGFDRAKDAMDRGSDIYMRGEVNPEDARSIAQTAEKAEGYSPMGTPKANYNAQLAQQEAQGYRDQLRQLGQEQKIPIAGQMTKLHQMLQGQKALNTPQTLDLNNPLTSLTKQALKETIGRPEFMSYGAAGANAASKLAPVASKAPSALQVLLKGDQQ